MMLKEKKRLEHLLKTKKWNPYSLRHSSITSDSDFLTEYALKKKVRWSMNSKLLDISKEEWEMI
jgi:integrase/recombinase XerD